MQDILNKQSMKLMLLTSISFASTYFSFAQKNSFLNELTVKWENARNYTIQVAQLVPESNYNYKPIAEVMTFAEQLSHLSNNMLWLSSGFLTEEKAPISSSDFNGKSKMEMINLSQKSFDFVSKVLKEFDPSELENKIEFAGQKMTKRQIFLLINDHLTHHRAQMIVYLRLMNIKPPRYIGW
jgi:uncharacterized damage-inducible protein DinB